MTSDKNSVEAFVWIWLPEETEPVVAGRLFKDAGDVAFSFSYGRSYLGRKNAIAIFEPELPLKVGNQSPLEGMLMPGAIKDGGPDAWGKRVIINRRFGTRRDEIDIDSLDELPYLLASGSDRAGALDFQASPTRYEPREAVAATLDELQNAADLIQMGKPLPPALDRVIFHGSSIGGARPKALIEQAGVKYIAKFSAQSDVFNVVKGEYIAMRLAELAGLNVARVRLLKAAGRDVLLVERFDRYRTAEGWARRSMVSGLTLLGLDEMMGRYASYEDLCNVIRARFGEPRTMLKELFGRLVLNIMTSNTDDHAKNHSAFWDGKTLLLTPAYDICPQGRSGNEATQAMLITGENRMSQLRACLDAAPNFLLSETDASKIIAFQFDIVRSSWKKLVKETGLSEVEENQMWRRQILNPFIFEGLPAPLAEHVASGLGTV